MGGEETAITLMCVFQLGESILSEDPRLFAVLRTEGYISLVLSATSKTARVSSILQDLRCIYEGFALGYFQ